MAETRCQNCGKIRDEAELITPIVDIGQRVAPGETMPVGECPDCGAVCHWTKFVTRAQLLEVLKGLLEWEARTGGWEAAAWSKARRLLEQQYEWENGQ